MIHNFASSYRENETRGNKLKKGQLSKYHYEKRDLNLTEATFNTEEKEMLAKGLKYAPPPKSNQETRLLIVKLLYKYQYGCLLYTSRCV